MDRYVDFWTVTQSSLSFALRRLGLQPGPAQAETLLDAYLTLAPFPEVKAALAALAPAPLGILSNGSPMMLDAAVRSAGLEGAFQHVLSVDAVGVYKPSPRVYEMGTRAFGVSAREILFVSSNAWDVTGAAAFGYRTCWCNRLGMPMDELDLTPDIEVERLDQIPERLGL
jgi:2-haloacid dehalogenase